MDQKNWPRALYNNDAVMHRTKYTELKSDNLSFRYLSTKGIIAKETFPQSVAYILNFIRGHLTHW